MAKAKKAAAKPVAKKAGGRAKAASAAPKEPKASAPKAPAVRLTAPNHPLDKEETRLLVEVHLPKIKQLREKVARATADLRNGYKTAKSEGFSKTDFDTAIAMEDAEREARARAAITRQLVIARMMKAKLGDQLDMFLTDAVVDSVQIATEEAQSDSAAGRSAKPDKYAPGTKEYEAYMGAYHDDQESRIKAGIKKKADKAEAPADAARQASVPQPVTSGVPMSRAAFLKQQQAAQEAAGEPVQTDIEDEADGDEDETSAFSRAG
jgi:hypothetical protein